jgi:Spy/CpxP family protein refolding chaperone
MNTRLTVILTFVSALAGFTTMQAQVMGQRAWIPDMLNPLGLTTAQVVQMQKLRLEYQKVLLPLRTELLVVQTKLHTLLLNPDKSDSEISETIKKITDLQVKARTKMLEYQTNMHNLLTDEQRKLATQMGYMPGCGFGLYMGGGGFGMGRAISGCGIMRRGWCRGGGWTRGTGVDGLGLGPCGLGLGPRGIW